MTKIIIRQKQSNSGSIYDIASDMFERKIKFRKGEKYAVCLPAYHGCFQVNARSIEAAYKKAQKLVRDGYSGIRIISDAGEWFDSQLYPVYGKEITTIA